MIEAMDKFKKDLRNSHYVCPIDFKTVHDYWINKNYRKNKALSDARQAKRLKKEKLNDIELQIRLKEERKIGKNKYAKRLLPFTNLKFTFGDLVIVPFLKLKEVKKAGKLMHHCIYKTSSYWQNENNLLFGSYYKGKLIETTQYALDNNKVYHSYGVLNTPSEHSNKIIQILEKSTHKILACTKPKRKLRKKLQKQVA